MMTATDKPPPFPDLNQSRLHNAQIFSFIGFASAFICAFLGYMKDHLGQAIPAIGGLCMVGFVGLGFSWHISRTYQLLVKSHVWLRANITQIQSPSGAEGDDQWWIIAEAIGLDGKLISVTSDPVSRIIAKRQIIGSKLWVAASPEDSRAYRLVIEN